MGNEFSLRSNNTFPFCDALVGGLRPLTPHRLHYKSALRNLPLPVDIESGEYLSGF